MTLEEFVTSLSDEQIGFLRDFFNNESQSLSLENAVQELERCLLNSAESRLIEAWLGEKK